MPMPNCEIKSAPQILRVTLRALVTTSTQTAIVSVPESPRTPLFGDCGDQERWSLVIRSSDLDFGDVVRVAMDYH